MAKNEAKALKKGKAQFNLVGRAKVTDKTFNIDNTYDSGWTDNQMYIGIDCGNGNVVYAEMRGGYFPNKDNIIKAYDKNDKDSEGRSKQIEVAWEDRLDEDLLDSIADTSFITVGVEKDTHNKTVYKKFLSAYDAVEYASEHLKNDTIVNVKGNLKYSEYEGNVTIKKEITSIVLSKVEDEKDFKATFTQTVLLDNSSIGKLDREKSVKYLNAYVVDYVGKPKIDGTKVEIRKNITYPVTFEIVVNNDNAETVSKMLNRYFKVIKKDVINEITVDGNIVEGSSVVEITDDDIPEDIKELMAMGLYTEDEAKAKCAIGNGNRERHMFVTRPSITYVGTDENRKPTVLVEEGKYSVSDLYFYEQALSDAGVEVDNDDNNNEVVGEDDDLLSMLDSLD